ncbi:MAG: nucleotide sugar dehydrogenase [Oligoflexia bacterium]|nr:nucleotide sugar dehydrogenase [Oligoflexia bacterium]
MSQTVLVVGTWHLGSVIGVCTANAGQNVYLWDQNDNVKSQWSKGSPPLHEPGLTDMATKLFGKNLFWASDLKSVSQKAQWIFLCYDTPIDDKDEILLDSVEDGFKTVLNQGFSNDCRFYFTSQLPVGTSRRFRNLITKANPHWQGHVIYQPENLRLGEAISCFLKPDRMVLGIDSQDNSIRNKLRDDFLKLTGITDVPVNLMSLETAEMTKHALNAFLAVSVVFANELAEICEETGADAWEVVASLKQDARIGPKAFLRPGMGFSGGTLARDVKTLSHLTPPNKNHSFFKELYSINQARNLWIKRQLESRLGSLKGKRITLLGVTYKPQTSTVRRSPALELGQLLKSEGAKLVALDPMADLSELTTAERQGLPFELMQSPEEALKKSHGAVLITEWPQFKELNWTQLKDTMEVPLLVDTKNFLSQIGQLGYRVVIPGKPKDLT